MKIISVLVLMFAAVFPSSGQGLEDISPVWLDSAYHNTDNNTSFIMTVLDYHELAKQGKTFYRSAVEIFDADQPWPPRWFTSTPFEWHDSMSKFEDLYMDARLQENGDISFFNRETTVYHSRTAVHVNGYITCNKKMEPVDTFNGIGLSLNFHDFRINSKGEKLVVALLDTTLNVSDMSGKKTDTNVKATVDIIEIFDKANNLIFKWNPVKVLGVGAFHWNYKWVRTFAAKPNYLDWSHCNAIDFDFDGNIIYSFRDIGIGKISRQDGHVIWRFDRNDVPFVSGDDTIAFYMQHGLDKVSDNKKYTLYELYNNGDYVTSKLAMPEANHPGSCGLLLKINKRDQSMQLVEKKEPCEETRSLTGGNYDVEKNGDYLMNYGYLSFRKQNENICTWPLMEYGNKKGQIYGVYNMPELIVPFKIHRLKGWRPPRPTVVVKSDGTVIAQGDMNEWVWYQVENSFVKKVGSGNSFRPESPGTYCVAGKYGIGWAVSRVFTYHL